MSSEDTEATLQSLDCVFALLDEDDELPTRPPCVSTAYRRELLLDNMEMLKNDLAILDWDDLSESSEDEEDDEDDSIDFILTDFKK